MGTYMALVDVRDTVQNVQKLASVWGDVRNEIHDLDGELLDAYAVLGEHDYLVLFEAPNREQALKMSLVVERRGLDMQTMEIIPVERFGELVEDF
ncbi:GYD domain-containing protein [Halomarina ordinaria]|uniref:GYD domain-containing protein n=1 Tax=Halomarina ordinaria TaxID=3033939 RepID=A0ABD5U816_9EURY|nr:GYD domain-containing protein [Halomarina sp. PSRA2]